MCGGGGGVRVRGSGVGVEGSHGVTHAEVRHVAEALSANRVTI